LGTIAAHGGRTMTGLSLLQKAEETLADDYLARMKNHTLQALYLVSADETSKADQLLAEPEKAARETSHFWLTTTTQLVRGMVKLKANEISDATELLHDALHTASEAGATHLVLYAHESLAVAAWRKRDRTDATRELQNSTRLRKKLRMAYTGWDEERLRELQTL
jgi:hypothetical protein